ncbi:hypothetical protein A2765_02445 [Candidatus Kaiserbacteria bacterium RIFCSPHIGHO2_01_FULL_56_24]|uniref:LTD domain-containing protein n=1 Tax=Candidatus Kaiserbacteria bacterium RIFCSPHIGHO2_01_FULL_56_24 TaxID=1798487 RepID=A0A1F6DC22_9BACT|nr:MAG: hypothetical protein A2765_02445 [Candidatus Kaiserbacteria bacterium RIFCSPHIGHO2_01_FULL_56_24]
MFRQIILALLAFIVIALLAMWIIGGGPRRSIQQIKDVTVLPFSPSTASGFRLPWQPAQLFPTLDITGALRPMEDTSDAQSTYYDLEAEYERLNEEAAKARTFGNPSAYSGTVSIAHNTAGVRATVAHDEYVEIAANFQGSTAIDIAGWSLESALSGTRAYIPGGASAFVMGAANVIGPVTLDPGAIAIISSAPSPVGISFRENSCTGYLGQFQAFSPELGGQCPSASSVLPLTEENLRLYGDTCFDELNALPACQFPQALPDTVTPACRAFLVSALSYNGCVNRERYRSSFQTNTWRVYLGGNAELWRNSHDAIRLLDAQGKTVDVFVY